MLVYMGVQVSSRVFSWFVVKITTQSSVTKDTLGRESTSAVRPSYLLIKVKQSQTIETIEISPFDV